MFLSRRIAAEMPAKARAARSKPDQDLAKGHWSGEPVRPWAGGPNNFNKSKQH
ncbi:MULTISPECIES: hypothetical protein [unclassified Oceanispirochaeta]|uniref:hypothetical protein n=1 Tax=unclassified Oceanispirochaeta TaxID=2635722 RepID=UPI0013148AC1|nr:MULTISPECIES: hypothetical protein [unclassified Oceanispirochaeta]MBF9015836.1 hypothetical protein [Oceanispirochaeta sp. M2]NPD72299.1 hypothetical protein [Oceanispirochaeta sp. M1]